jgi:L-cystine uptake protein TcyP (sodium:dicarboxylate symporter family)
MFYNLKNNFLCLLLVGILFGGSLAFLTHHSMPVTDNIDDSCRTSCVTESSSAFAIAMPRKLNILLLVILPLIAAAIVYVAGKLFAGSSFAYLHNIGPPLYKRFEVYRI